MCDLIVSQSLDLPAVWSMKDVPERLRTPKLGILCSGSDIPGNFTTLQMLTDDFWKRLLKAVTPALYFSL